jgi:hypothetical protein
MKRADSRAFGLPRGKFFSSLCLFAEVDAYVKPTVVPVGLVIAAPFAVVVLDL